MSSIFVSAIPKSVARSEVEEFLRRSFPTSVEVNVLRAAGGEETHKGHAYVHFDSASDASCAFAKYSSKTSTELKNEINECNDVNHADNNNYNMNNKREILTLNGAPLRLRLSTASQTKSYKKDKEHKECEERQPRKENKEITAEPTSAFVQKEWSETRTLPHLEHLPSPSSLSLLSHKHHVGQYINKDDRTSNEKHDKADCAELVCGPPLPPAFIHCYWRCCAYDCYHKSNKPNVNSKEQENINDNANINLPSFRYVMPLTMHHDSNKKSKSTATMLCGEPTNTSSDHYITGHTLPCVAEFCTPEDCQRAVEFAPERFVPVGAPLLEELMQSPSSSMSTSCHSFTSNGQVKRMRHDKSYHNSDDDVQKKVKNERDDKYEHDKNVDATLQRWRDEGFSLLTPVEALKELEKLFNGQGRVAVKDESGSIAILRVPTYVASIE